VNLLINKTILITKSESDAKNNLDLLINEGAEIIYCPTIKIIPAVNSPELDDALMMFNNFNYLIFTSSNAVDVFTAVARERKINLSRIKVAAVGISTAEKCEASGITVDILPDEFSSSGLIDKFLEFDLTGKKILIPGSSFSRSELSEGLRELGAEVYSVPIYDVATNDIGSLKNIHKKIQRKHPNLFVFTSPSSFYGFLKIMSVADTDKYFLSSIICSIGSTTESAVREKGLSVHIVPQVFSLHGVSEAIINYYKLTANMA